MREEHARKIRSTARTLRREVFLRAMPRAPQRPLRSLDSARIVGLLSSASGIGMSARLCASALRQSGVAVESANVAAYFNADDQLPFDAAMIEPQHRADCSIYHLNPPMLLRGFLASGLKRYYAAYNIGYWAWELESVPREWQRAAAFVDAIFVPSQFCAKAIAKVTQKPVLVVPHPVPTSNDNIARSPQATDKPFTVLSVFNLGSSLERKNPFAMIEAFKRAFKPDERVKLILKTSDGPRYRADFDRLQSAVAGHPTIEIVDAVWTARQMSEAFANADAFLSMHRSEGFGLSIAEAIVQETPVVVTGWSGNTDFCDPKSTYLIGSTLVPFRDQHGDYAEIASARWADADVDHAAQLLAEIRDQPVAARAHAVAARRYLEDYLAKRTYKNALAELLQRDDGRSDADQRLTASEI